MYIRLSGYFNIKRLSNQLGVFLPVFPAKRNVLNQAFSGWIIGRTPSVAILRHGCAGRRSHAGRKGAQRIPRKVFYMVH